MATDFKKFAMNKKTHQNSSCKLLLWQRENPKVVVGYTSNGDGIKDWQPPERYQTVSLKSIAGLLDTTRSSARRWLKEAGIKPIALGRGVKGAIRYRWEDIETWLNTREQVD